MGTKLSTYTRAHAYMHVSRVQGATRELAIYLHELRPIAHRKTGDFLWICGGVL